MNNEKKINNLLLEFLIIDGVKKKVALWYLSPSGANHHKSKP